MLKLDLKDRKILYELDINSRQTFQKIAKKVGLSKENVFYRIKKLEKQGIIRQYSTIINPGKLCFTAYRIFLKFQNITTNKEKEIITYLEEERAVAWFAEIEGNWDLNINILCENAKQLNDFWKKLEENYSNFIADYSFSIFTNITYFSKSYLLNKNNEKSFVFVSLAEKEKTGKIDKAILELMATNSRIKITEIAAKLKASVKTIAKRIKKLEKNKVITGHKILLDLEKLGYLFYKIHFKLQNCDEKTLRKFKQIIFQHPNIVYEDSAIGGPDIEIEVQVEDTEKFHKIIKELRDKFSDVIKEYETMQYLKEHKFMTQYYF